MRCSEVVAYGHRGASARAPAEKRSKSSLNTIGEAFGGRDHGTVLHACRLVQDRMQVDSQVRQTVTYLEKQLLR